MLLSIIIPIFNDASYLEETLRKIDLEDIEDRTELVLVDSSSDDSAFLVVSEFRLKRPSVQIIYEKIEPSFAGRSMNKGIQLSSGKFLGFLDTKTIPTEDWPNGHLEILRDSEVGVVFGTTEYEASTKFQQLLKAASYGNILHESVPGSVLKKEVFNSTGLFSPNLRSSYDIEWKNKVKQFALFKTPDFRTILYSKLPKNFIDAAKKYFIQNEKVQTYIQQESFYTDKYCLAIDLRTINDEAASGIGREIRDNIKIKKSKNTTDSAGKVYVFLISDKAVRFINNELGTIDQ